jgi:hypothetical protein
MNFLSSTFWLLPLADLLKRVFIFDAMNFHFCFTSSMKIIAFIKDHEIVAKILKHLSLPSDPPRIVPARDPPQKNYFDQIIALFLLTAEPLRFLFL